MPKEKKHKKDKKRSRSRSRSRSPKRSRSRSRSESRERDRKRRRKDKDESAEERAARKEAKKKEKLALQQKQKELFGYSNESNPFGDQNLSQAFVWKKKIERDISKGADPRAMTKSQLKAKQAELRDEIERVKQRRAEREAEKAQMEEMRDMQKRNYEADVVEGWEQKEEQFHLNQAKIRSEIRIKEGREKPIDILAKNINLFNKATEEDLSVDMDVELMEPYKIFTGLSLPDLEDLRKDLQVQLELGSDLEYWQALMTICEDELAAARGIAKGIHVKLPEAVKEQVALLMDGKSRRELDQLQKEIQSTIDGRSSPGGEIIDVPFWESLLKQQSIFRAKAFLRELHEDLLKQRLSQLRQQQRKAAVVRAKEKSWRATDAASSSSSSAGGSGAAPMEDEWEPELQPYDNNNPAPSSSSSSSSSAASAPAGAGAGAPDGSLSPVLMRDVDPARAVDPEQDLRELFEARRRVLEKKQREDREVQKQQQEEKDKVDQDPGTALVNAGMGRFMLTPDQMVEAEGARGMEDDEAKFSEEIKVPDTPYWWHDKYRPRKPRYFNRVKTGFEWNKYNQTHYDKENPPPKTVQGYKFNIFYPDLIDPTKAPQYKLENIPGEPDYCIIRFTAGPPYEDIAFKIVKKEWNFARQHGYKCVYDRGVLQLYFNFKRFRYRR